MDFVNIFTFMSVNGYKTGSEVSQKLPAEAGIGWTGGQQRLDHGSSRTGSDPPQQAGSKGAGTQITSSVHGTRQPHSEGDTNTNGCYFGVWLSGSLMPHPFT